MIVDAHQHFWRYEAKEYDWIGDELAALRRDFLPPDLGRELGAAAVDVVVSVQARQTLGETRWLLELAEANEFVAGVVGWVPLVSPTVADTLAELADDPRLCGVRHVRRARRTRTSRLARTSTGASRPCGGSASPTT